MCWISRLFTGTIERASPSDFVPRGSIVFGQVNGDTKISINLSQLNVQLDNPPLVWMPDVPDTNSMDPCFDREHNNILIQGTTPGDQQKLIDYLKVGDIAVYRIPPGFIEPQKFYAIHRMVEVGTDNEGRYFRFKGDNNYARDPYKARDKNILWVSIGTIF